MNAYINNKQWCFKLVGEKSLIDDRGIQANGIYVSHESGLLGFSRKQQADYNKKIKARDKLSKKKDLTLAKNEKPFDNKEWLIKGSRVFTYFNSVNELYHYLHYGETLKKKEKEPYGLSKIHPEDMNFYEIIPGIRKQKPHFDIDISLKDLIENPDKIEHPSLKKQFVKALEAEDVDAIQDVFDRVSSYVLNSFLDALIIAFGKLNWTDWDLTPNRARHRDLYEAQQNYDTFYRIFSQNPDNVPRLCDENIELLECNIIPQLTELSPEELAVKSRECIQKSILDQQQLEIKHQQLVESGSHIINTPSYIGKRAYQMVKAYMYNISDIERPKNLSNIELNLEEDVLIFQSHGEEKRSFHVVICNYFHLNNKDAKDFYTKVIRYMKKYKCFVDPAVYSGKQQFRMLGSTKRKAKRYKTLMTEFYYSGQCITHKYKYNTLRGKIRLLEKSLVSICYDCYEIPSINDHACGDDMNDESYIPKTRTFKLKTGPKYITEYKDKDLMSVLNKEFGKGVFKLKGRVDTNILLERLKPSYCGVCDRKHEKENPYLKIMSNGTIFFNCRRTLDNRSTTLKNKLTVKAVQCDDEDLELDNRNNNMFPDEDCGGSDDDGLDLFMYD